MPLILPDRLPAIEFLREENIFVLGSQRADTQDIRPLRIAILNLMPLKITTETDLVRLLSNSPLQLEIHLMKVKAHTSKNTPIEHMRAFYRDFEEMRPEKFDGMIITGAPVEQMPYEEVDYWDELCKIMEWSKTHVYSVMHICWGAMAGLYYHYGIPKYDLPEKCFGVFEHSMTWSKPVKLFRGFNDVFYVPHSRHTELRRDDIAKIHELRILSESPECGVYAVSDRKGRMFFLTGHSEYDRYTLDSEYKRDVSLGRPIKLPINYYKDNDPSKEPVMLWRASATLLFTNWLNYYVYQETPFDLSLINEEKKNKIDLEDT